MPGNLDPSRMCTIRPDSNAINRAQVASAATRVIREHNLSHKTWGVVKRPVSFHRYNAVRDHKADRSYSHKTTASGHPYRKGLLSRIAAAARASCHNCLDTIGAGASGCISNAMDLRFFPSVSH